MTSVTVITVAYGAGTNEYVATSWNKNQSDNKLPESKLAKSLGVYNDLKVFIALDYIQ